MAESLQEYLDFGTDLARKAGALIKEVFYTDKAIETKCSAVDLVTETDKRVENMIQEAIKDNYPNHQFIGEESVSGGKKCVLTDEPTWIVDPIDGTTNFVHKFPYSAVCLGLVINKETVIGVVYNPILDEMFTAKRGCGSQLNGKKISVSKQKDFHQSLIMTEFGSSRDPDQLEKKFKNIHAVISAPVHAIHSLGTAALNMCMVATGGAEAYYEFGIHCWDYCAASLIVEEAGGVVIDTAGGPVDLMRRRLIGACNMEIASSLSKTLKEQIELPRD